MCLLKRARKSLCVAGITGGIIIRPAEARATVGHFEAAWQALGALVALKERGGPSHPSIFDRGSWKVLSDILDIYYRGQQQQLLRPEGGTA